MQHQNITTVKDAIDTRTELEAQIKDLLNKFESSTGLRVSHIDFVRAIPSIASFHNTEIVNVQLEVVL